MTKCYAGLDWASRSHAVCVIDARGSVRSDFEVTHDAAGLAELCRRLKAAHISAVAIERPSGLVVDALVEAGLQVVPIHPNAVKATRPRYRSHGGKSDACDAYLLADLLRTDGHRFKPLMAQGDEIRALRALVRGRDEPLEMDAKGELVVSIERLAAEAGVTPVTYESGKTKAVAFRWACNHRLRAAITCLADNSRHASAWAAHVYETAKARGCDHPHAIRILARAWLRVIWRAWQDRTTYDPLRHAAAMLHLASVGG